MVSLVRRSARSTAVLVALGTFGGALQAQAPNEAWRTITSPHFAVHFPVALESVARRAGGSAERAYAKLAPLLPAPRGRIDLVLTDHVDYSNGFALVSPSPRIVIFARPPVDDRTLRFREDWLDLVVQHELVHVFHLNRTRGWWRLAQGVFGRQPMLFPNTWAPSWLLEGLAVHYESALGDGGRIEGLTHLPYAYAKANEGALPRFGDFSVASLDFPGGTNAYVWGSLLVQSMEARGGRGSVERFVDHSSGRLLPWTFESSAERDFGVRFAAQWKSFTDSLQRAVSALPTVRAEVLTAAQWYTRFPRVAPSGRVLFVAANGRDATGLYALPADGGAPVRIARRNSLEPNVELRDGRVLFAQGEWLDPWRYRSDLWVRAADGTEQQVTHGARLFAPDARMRDGAVVAAQNATGTTHLVRVDGDGRVTPLTSASLDTTWSAPRWSHDGARVAATRWVRGGTMQVVVLDTLGHVMRVAASARATIDEPSWSADDASLVFAVNASGTSSIWRVDVATGALHASAASATSVDSPEASSTGLLGIETRARGERLVRVPMPSLAVSAIPSIADQQPATTPDTITGAVQPYRPWRQLVPRYWMPMVETTDENRTGYGALISGNDIVGRHYYAATLTHEPDRGENAGSVVYRYAGLGLPLIDVSMRQTWDHTPLVDSARVPVGTLARRRRYVGGALTLVRQRARQSAVVSGSAELELRDFVTDPASLLPRLGSPLYLTTLKYPTFGLGAVWSNARTPMLALGPEDGVAVAASGRWRWRTDDPSATRSATYVMAVNAFKSLPFLPGASHHVLAVHGAMATADDRTNSELTAGGISGASVEIAPGLVAGDVRRTFFVRGFAPGAQSGIRALAASAEYRAPLAILSRGARFVPFFAQRTSLTFFADAGTAWCPAGARSNTVGCPRGETMQTWMSSIGGELALDAAVLNYDTPYRLRIGYARPTSGRTFSSEPQGSIYFSLGLSF